MPQDGPKIVPRALLAALVRSWTALEALFGGLGAVLSHLGAILSGLGPLLGGLGVVLGRLEAILGGEKAILGRSWSGLESFGSDSNEIHGFHDPPLCREDGSPPGKHHYLWAPKRG